VITLHHRISSFRGRTRQELVTHEETIGVRHDVLVAGIVKLADRVNVRRSQRAQLSRPGQQPSRKTTLQSDENPAHGHPKLSNQRPLR